MSILIGQILDRIVCLSKVGIYPHGLIEADRRIVHNYGKSPFDSDGVVFFLFSIAFSYASPLRDPDGFLELLGLQMMPTGGDSLTLSLRAWCTESRRYGAGACSLKSPALAGLDLLHSGMTVSCGFRTPSSSAKESRSWWQATMALYSLTR